MYQIVVHIKGMTKTCRFEERTEVRARRFVETLARAGFWIPRSQPAAYMPPSRITLLEVSRMTSKKSGTRARRKMFAVFHPMF